jgi:hypothetical protein
MTTAVDPTAAGIVEDHLARISTALGRRDTVRDDVIDEVRDCLLTAVERRVAGGMPPDAAARDAILDYGDLTQVAPAVAADVIASRAQASATAILRSGPIAAAVWTAVVLTTRTGPVPSPWRAALTWLGPAVLLTVAGALVAYGAACRPDRWRARVPRAAATTATATCALTDLAALAFIAAGAAAGGQGWFIVLAAAISAVRILVVGRRARALWSPRPARPAP